MKKNIARPNIFEIESLNLAKKIILTPEKGFSTEERWKIETVEHCLALAQLIESKFTVLDFGIGIGRIANKLLKEIKNLKIIGIDSSEKMLLYCREYIDAGLQNRLQLFPFDKISRIPDNSIDLIYSIYVIQHVPALFLEKALFELRRILKPDGCFYIFNLYKRSAVDNVTKRFYDDKIDQLSLIGKYFDYAKDIPYKNPYMKRFLEDHFSKLYIKKHN